MLIAFEGPDKAGKSTSACNLSSSLPIYNATKENYTETLQEMQGESGVVQCFDRIDWLTHMAYRLALPGHEWNDPRVRTVFAMPDTHLVFKLHERRMAGGIADELYEIGTLATVNDLYGHLARFIMDLNEQRDWALFKTVTILEVRNEGDEFSSRLVYFSSPVFKHSEVATPAGESAIAYDQTLLEMLQYEDSQRL